MMVDDIKGLKRVVVDASVVLALLIPDENSKTWKNLWTDVVKNKTQVLAPSLLWYEVGNGLRSAVLRKRISKQEAFKLWNKFLLLPIKIFSPNLKKTLETSVKEKLSFYDASYVCLSRVKKLNLISLDKKLSSVV